MKKGVLLLFAVILCVGACNKDESEHPKSIFETGRVWLNYLECYQQLKDSERTYFIQSYNGISNTPEEDHSQTIASIPGNLAPYNLLIDSISLNYAEFYYSVDHNFSTSQIDTNLKDFFGRHFDMAFVDSTLFAKSDGSISNPMGQVYIPMFLYPVSFENLTADEKITAGSVVKWTKDLENNSGVVIELDYNASTQSDPENRINYPDDITTAARVEDTGGYIFKIEDFSFFPDNANLGFTISRSGCSTFEYKSGKSCTLSGSTIVISGQQLDKSE